MPPCHPAGGAGEGGERRVAPPRRGAPPPATRRRGRPPGRCHRRRGGRGRQRERRGGRVGAHPRRGARRRGGAGGERGDRGGDGAAGAAVGTRRPSGHGAAVAAVAGSVLGAEGGRQVGVEGGGRWRRGGGRQFCVADAGEGKGPPPLPPAGRLPVGRRGRVGAPQHRSEASNIPDATPAAQGVHKRILVDERPLGARRGHAGGGVKDARCGGRERTTDGGRVGGGGSAQVLQRGGRGGNVRCTYGGETSGVAASVAAIVVKIAIVVARGRRGVLKAQSRQGSRGRCRDGGMTGNMVGATGILGQWVGRGWGR